MVRKILWDNPNPPKVTKPSITFSPRATISEVFAPAMEITDRNKAKEYFEALVYHCQKYSEPSKEKAIKIVKSNLGYYAGYYNEETRARIEDLFDCSHPIFGKIVDGKPTPEAALRAGLELGEMLKSISKKVYDDYDGGYLPVYKP